MTPTNTVSDPAHIAKCNGQLWVHGVVCFDSVASLRQQGEQLLAGLSQPAIHFSNAKCADSSALLLILAWRRYARDHNKTIHWQGVPDTLFAVAEVYGIKDVISLQSPL